jgi:hypothetical protein
MRKIVPFAHDKAVFAALVGFTVLAAPFDSALSQAQGPPTASVNVVNPPTSPVPTTVRNPATMPALTSSIDDPGRVPYEGAVTGGTCSPTFCESVFASVPQGHRLVVQRISGFASLLSSPGFVNLNAGSSTKEFVEFLVTVPTPLNSNGVAVSGFNEPVLFYLDAGSTPRVSAFPITGSANISAVTIISLAGYLLDCTSSPCAPIAH